MRYLFLFFIPILCFGVPCPKNRTSQAPYVSGDAFRAFCDHVYDDADQSSLNPKDVRDGDTIFVQVEDCLNGYLYFNDFIKNIHSKITTKYILITHNSDQAIPGRFKELLDNENIIAWFSTNCDGTVHSKLHPIPIGIANLRWPQGQVKVIENIKKKKTAKDHLVYLNISVHTYPSERFPVYTQFSQANFCYNPPGKPFAKYLLDLVSSKFSISPRGNGLDTHRLWESLYLGTIPIVKSSSLDNLYEDLPVLIIDDWAQVTEEFLNKKYIEFSEKKYSMEKLHFSYWETLIHSYRLDYRPL